MSAPLTGVRVLVTRPRKDEDELSRLLEAQGAIVTHLPLVVLGPPPDEAALRRAVERADEFAWLVFTSAAGVEAFADHRTADRPLPGVRLAAVGPATARAVAARLGRAADLVPERYDGESLARALETHTRVGDRILILAAEGARPALRAHLRSVGREVESVAAYTTLEVQPPEAADIVAGSDVVTLTSASAVRSLVRALGPQAALRLRGIVVACLGPVTLHEARHAGLHVEVVPDAATFAGFVEALCTYYTTLPGTP